MDLTKANNILIKLADKYQNIKHEKVIVPVPYFINTAEQIYKQEMRNVGVEDEIIKKIIQQVKNGETPLGSGGGKGSPKKITQSLGRLMKYLDEQGYHPKKPVHIRKWMVEMHIGLDCSGYIYNILDSIEKDQGIELLKHLAWTDNKTMKPSHAGCFIFDSKNLEEINDYSDLIPLDIFIGRDYNHIGILVKVNGQLCLTECSMGENGISFSNLSFEGDKLVVEGNESWTKSLKSGEIIIRRLNF